MVLFVDACAREKSRTRKIAEALLHGLQEAEIETVDLYSEDLKPLIGEQILFRDRALQEGDFSDEYFDLAKQFANADLIIMAAPYWDMSFPAILKLYVERISVNGITFRYREDGTPEGLCRGKKLFYVTTSGGEIGKYNFGYDYIKALTMALFGIDDATCVRVVGLDMEGTDVAEVLANAENGIKELLK